jgi:hypothetical protein
MPTQNQFFNYSTGSEMKQIKVELYIVDVRIEGNYQELRVKMLGEYTETDKSYVAYGERKSKDKVMALSMGYHSGQALNCIYYETMCLKHQIEDAKTQVMQHAEKELSRRIELIEKMRINYLKLILP